MQHFINCDNGEVSGTNTNVFRYCHSTRLDNHNLFIFPHSFVFPLRTQTSLSYCSFGKVSAVIHVSVCACAVRQLCMWWLLWRNWKSLCESVMRGGLSQVQGKVRNKFRKCEKKNVPIRLDENSLIKGALVWGVKIKMLLPNWARAGVSHLTAKGRLYWGCIAAHCALLLNLQLNQWPNKVESKIANLFVPPAPCLSVSQAPPHSALPICVTTCLQTPTFEQ